MSFQPLPAELADVIVQRLSFSTTPAMDEFSISNYIHRIRAIQDTRTLTPREYEALAMLHYAKQQYKSFADILNEGLRQYQNDLELVSCMYIGLFSMVQLKLSDIEFDMYESWFSHPANSGKKPIAFASSSTGCELAGRRLNFIKPMNIDLLLNKDMDFRASAGPFDISFRYGQIKSLNFEFAQAILVEFINRLACEQVVAEEVAYLKNILGTENFEYIKQISDPEPNEETLRAIESTDIDSEYESSETLVSALFAE